MIALYTVLMTLLLVIAYPAAFFLNLFGWTYLWKRIRVPKIASGGDSKSVWIHAASVGEAGIAFSMAREIKKPFPGKRIYISTITSTGLDSIRRMMSEANDAPVSGAFLAPVDHPFIIGGFMERLNPETFILVETELWPCLLGAMKKRGIPVSIINAKLSRRSFRRYMSIKSGIRNLVDGISLVCVQARQFARRYRMIGVPQDRIEVIGNVKFDGLPEPPDFDRDEVRSDLKIPTGAGVFVAGSTRPGEEKIVASAFRSVLDEYPDACMIIAPRHLNRVSEVERILDEAGLTYTKRSGGESITETGKNVLILDTLGELVRTFASADIAFVGGSLGDYGGHNPLEPAALGVPVLFGSYMEQTGAKELLSDGAAVLVHDAGELADAVTGAFAGKEKYIRMREAGPSVVTRFKGTLTRTLSCMHDRGLI